MPYGKAPSAQVVSRYYSARCWVTGSVVLPVPVCHPRRASGPGSDSSSSRAAETVTSGPERSGDSGLLAGWHLCGSELELESSLWQADSEFASLSALGVLSFKFRVRLGVRRGHSPG